MTQYIIRRLLLMILTVLAVTLVLFILIRVTPGDPVAIEFGLEGTPEQIEAYRECIDRAKPSDTATIERCNELLR